MQELLGIITRLRGPDGCAWDQEQTHLSLRPYLLEEAAEATDAITAGDMHELRAELGDVLLQVAFHSVLAQENADFDYRDVERGIVEKMVRRHPHVFGDSAALSSTEVKSNWQSIKAAERAGKAPRTLSEQIPAALGALAREQQRQHLTRPDQTSQAPDPITTQELGEQLSVLVSRAARAGLNAELVLREYTNAQISRQDSAHD